MKLTRIVFAAAAALALFATGAIAADPARLAGAVKGLERAVYAPAPAALIRARAELEALSRAEPKSAALHYWVAVADWRLVPRLDDPRQGRRFCQDGLDHADQAAKLDPRMAEAPAIKAGLQGLWLRYEPGASMTVGMEIETNLRRAVELDPSNPRVRLLDGINTLHKPAFVGGGAAPALAKLEVADSLFTIEAGTDSTAPAWGRAEASIWAGRSAVQLGQLDRARAFYTRALAIDPGNGWVRQTLIPELDRAVATASAKSQP